MKGFEIIEFEITKPNKSFSVLNYDKGSIWSRGLENLMIVINIVPLADRKIM